MADGGQADTLFYKLTHACGCMYFTERVSARPPGLPFSIDIPIFAFLLPKCANPMFFEPFRAIFKHKISMKIGAERTKKSY